MGHKAQWECVVSQKVYDVYGCMQKERTKEETSTNELIDKEREKTYTGKAIEAGVWVDWSV